MKLRRNKDRSFGLNTTSTADISFMLLVFFLVTTSMYVDKGLTRQLPPKDSQEEEKKDLLIDKENIMSITLDAEGNVSVNDTLKQMKELKDMMRGFILDRGEKHLLTIDADPSCPYDAYFHLQNSLVEAYDDAREATARRLFGREMRQLTSIDRERVLEKVPQRVAENYHEEVGE